MKLGYQVALVFVCVYVFGDIFNHPHFDNIVFALCMTLGFTIYHDLHKMAWQKMRGKYAKNN